MQTLASQKKKALRSRVSLRQTELRVGYFGGYVASSPCDALRQTLAEKDGGQTGTHRASSSAFRSREKLRNVEVREDWVVDGHIWLRRAVRQP